ncbi:MAG: DUF1844 domain-containing protein [candidate division Zixibacteria bacterium]|nr:DUF1844 domain-containing protein [candidate division Zixibacteria bacterium]MDH3938451.1 DUF1844 domain-containing protein [candidate division Zixibacteria bacterium]MDH4035151.1 DUF1844 domain-containing protein [candidate division Zixibacteria bacterium]
MNQFDEKMDPYFFQLVVSLQGGAMQQMGKIASPLTGKVERSLDMAKSSIDMLGMVKEKTEGNLSDEEKKLIEHVLYELRLNYVDELKKPGEPSTESRETDQAASAEEPESDQAEAGADSEAETETDKD